MAPKQEMRRSSFGRRNKPTKPAVRAEKPAAETQPHSEWNLPIRSVMSPKLGVGLLVGLYALFYVSADPYGRTWVGSGCFLSPVGGLALAETFAPSLHGRSSHYVSRVASVRTDHGDEMEVPGSWHSYLKIDHWERFAARRRTLRSWKISNRPGRWVSNGPVGLTMQKLGNGSGTCGTFTGYCTGYLKASMAQNLNRHEVQFCADRPNNEWCQVYSKRTAKDWSKIYWQFRCQPALG